MGHRRYLDPNHPFQKYIKSFNGKQVLELAPEPFSGEEIYERVCDIKTQFEKKVPSNKDTKAEKSKGKARGRKKGKRKRQRHEKEKVKHKCKCTDKDKLEDHQETTPFWKKKIHIL